MTPSENYLKEKLLDLQLPIISHYDFFRLIQSMYLEGKNLSLKKNNPTKKDHLRYFRKLSRLGVIKSDSDYGQRLIRVIDVPEQSAEEIVCLADPLCYVSHLSAMQIWGFTDRTTFKLMCTRPNRELSRILLWQMMEDSEFSLPPKQYFLVYSKHPSIVRGRRIRMIQTRKNGESISMSDSSARISTIGQTFLDMLQKPNLCGGMPHVLDVFDEFAEKWIDDVVYSVDSSDSSIVKCRAGHIIEERLGIEHEKIEAWKSVAQRGGTRKLDPTKEYSPTFSETWSISLNV